MQEKDQKRTSSDFPQKLEHVSIESLHCLLPYIKWPKQCSFPSSIVFPSPPLSFTQSKHWGHRCKLNKAETETESANSAIMQRIAQSEDHRWLLLLLLMKLP